MSAARHYYPVNHDNLPGFLPLNAIIWYSQNIEMKKKIWKKQVIFTKQSFCGAALCLIRLKHLSLSFIDLQGIQFHNTQ